MKSGREHRIHVRKIFASSWIATRALKEIDCRRASIPDSARIPSHACQRINQTTCVPGAQVSLSLCMKFWLQDVLLPPCPRGKHEKSRASLSDHESHASRTKVGLISEWIRSSSRVSASHDRHLSSSTKRLDFIPTSQLYLGDSSQTCLLCAVR